MNKQEKEQQKALKEIEAKLAQVDALLAEAAYIAEKENVYFNWDGPTYGAGVSYVPKQSYFEDCKEDLEEDGITSIDQLDDDHRENYDGGYNWGWQSSSSPGC